MTVDCRLINYGLSTIDCGLKDEYIAKNFITVSVKANSSSRTYITQVVLYSASLAVLLFLLKWLQWKFLILDNSIEIYIGLIAIFFTFLGSWVAKQATDPKIKTVIVEKEVYISRPDEFIPNEAELEKLQLSAREREVLTLLSKGMSNAEIAESLFLSLSTIKTHASNLFVKLDVKSRTQAIEKARRLRLVA